MIKKLVSVILPAYKMGQFIGEAWESVGGRTYPFGEVLAGGALGYMAGGSIGEAAGNIGGRIKNFFGGNSAQNQTNNIDMSNKPNSTNIQFSEMEFAKNDPENYKKFVEFKDKKTEEIYKKELESRKLTEKSSPQILETIKDVSQTKAKVEAIKTFQKEIEAAGAGKTTTSNQTTNISGDSVSSSSNNNSSTSSIMSRASTSNVASLTPTASPTTGALLGAYSSANKDLADSTGGTTVINNTTSGGGGQQQSGIIPLKPQIRPEYNSMSRYFDRVSVY